MSSASLRSACRHDQPSPLSTIIIETSRLAGIVALGVSFAFAVLLPLEAQQSATACACRITGRAISGTTALPGVSIVVLNGGDTVKAVTSTNPDGTYRLNVPPGAYRLRAELTGFDHVERELAIDAAPCDRTIDLSLTLAPRGPRPAPATAAASPLPGAPPAAAPSSAASGRGGQAASGAVPGSQRFATLEVQTQSTAAGLEFNPPERDEAEGARLLLPPGFSTEGPTQALAINGNMASIDRGMMNDRLDAIGRGEFDPVTGE